MSIKTAVLNGVASIELARPQKKNAFDDEMYRSIATALQAAQDDAKVRSVLLYGQPDIFSAGTDLEDFAAGKAMEIDSPLRLFMEALKSFEKPVVAAVNGPAIGIAAAMLLHCDLVYAGDTASFAFPFVTLGIVPEFGASYLLSRLAGRMHAAEKLLLAQPFNAQEALDMGMLNAVLPQGEVINHARRTAERFNKLPPAAVQATKRLMRQYTLPNVDAAMENEAFTFNECIGGAEVKEVFSAFLNKRWPDFSKF